MRVTNSLLFLILFFANLAFAQNQYNELFLLGLHFKAEALRDKAKEEIKKIDSELNTLERIIRKAQQIIHTASQRTDEDAKKAEKVAREALMWALEAKRKNEEIKREWERKKIMADRSYATIQNMLSQKIGSKSQIKGFITNYKGNIYILKANGERVSPDNGFLEPGDRIWTADGTATIEMLDGRATTQIGPYSEFRLEKDSPYEQLAELLKGKVYIAILSLEDYTNKMEEVAKKYEKDIQTIKEEIDKYLKKKRFKVKSSPIVSAPRATKLVVEVKDIQSAEIIVLEGSVEVSSLSGDKVVIVNEGYKVIATQKGIEGPEKITDLNKWWDE